MSKIEIDTIGKSICKSIGKSAHSAKIDLQIDWQKKSFANLIGDWQKSICKLTNQSLMGSLQIDVQIDWQKSICDISRQMMCIHYTTTL